MAGCVSVLSLLVCVFVTGVHAQLYYWLNLQVGKQQVHPPAWAETLRSGLGPQRLGEVALYFVFYLT